MPTLFSKVAAMGLVALACAAVTGAASAKVTPSPTTSIQAGEPAATGQKVIADGHVDIGPRFVNGKWIVQVLDGTANPPVWRNLDDVVLQAVDTAKAQVPDGGQFSFLGRPGAQVWVLPQVQQQGVLWPGWNTQDPQVASTVNREVTWRLRKVTGPGRFVLFVNGDFGAPKILFDGSRPHVQQTGIDLNTHAHGNWAFSAPGTYLLDLDMSARTLQGGQVSDRRLLRIFVGPGSADAAFNAPPPPGFVAGGTTTGTGPTESESESDEGVPLWIWLIAGATGATLVIAVTTLVLGSRRGAAATGRETGVNETKPALDIEDLAVDLGGRRVLTEVRLQVAVGELVGLIGPNGAGKTTLLRAALGLIPVASGRIRLDGATPAAARGSVGYVPQRHEFAWDFPISVEKAVMSGRAHRIGRFRRPGKDDRAAVAEALEQVGMAALRRRPIGELSGGQRQRVLVARALALRPLLLLLDEPFTGLDVPTQEALTGLFRRLREDKAVLMTTHDLQGAALTCGRLCLLNETVIADGPPSELRDPAVWLRAFGGARNGSFLEFLGADSGASS